MIGIILAGGRGSRLALVNGSGSKALVSVGNRPHLLHQIELLRRAGCSRIKVVTSPRTDPDVATVIERAGIDAWGVSTVIQKMARGPVDALYQVIAHESVSETAHVLMSDTYLSEELRAGTGDVVTVGVAQADKRRSWAYWDEQTGQWVDGEAGIGQVVTIGAYHLPNVGVAAAAAYFALKAADLAVEVPMSVWLNEMDCTTTGYSTWHDLGDIEALQRARTSGFMTREFHGIRQVVPGLLEKTGAPTLEGLMLQRDWMENQSNIPAAEFASIVPRTWNTKRGYMIEHIDLPTLSEMWLYRDAQPESWAYVLSSVIDQLDRRVWGVDRGQVKSDTWFVHKAMVRLALWDSSDGDASFLLGQLGNMLPYGLESVQGHGDLNFNNVFYSPSTGAVKLIDPRGDEEVPILYEIAKLRASYHGGFSAITHGLYSGSNLLPQRDAEIEAMDSVLADFGYTVEQLDYAEACILLAATALHPEHEARALYARGLDLLRGVIE